MKPSKPKKSKSARYENSRSYKQERLDNREVEKDKSLEKKGWSKTNE